MKPWTIESWRTNGGCDIPIRGSDYRQFHADDQRPLFAEAPDLPLPAYMLNVGFVLVPITSGNGPLEIAPGTHRMSRDAALRAVESAKIETQTIALEIGDLLVRHPWALHRGTPNATHLPRPLVTIRYVRRWYTDNSREVSLIPRAVWQTLTPERDRRRIPFARARLAK